MNLIQENILILRAKAGDEAAAKILIDRHYMDVYRFLYKLCSSKPLAQDLTQDTFFKVWQCFNKFHGKSRFKSWVFRISHNLFIDHCRKSKIISTDDYYDIHYLESESIIGKSEKEMTLSSLKKLSPKLKIVILLHYFNELTHKEIGFILEIPIGTVKSRLNAGLSQLRKSLQNQNIFLGK